MQEGLTSVMCHTKLTFKTSQYWFYISPVCHSSSIYFFHFYIVTTYQQIHCHGNLYAVHQAYIKLILEEIHCPLCVKAGQNASFLHCKKLLQILHFTAGMPVYCSEFYSIFNVNLKYFLK